MFSSEVYLICYRPTMLFTILLILSILIYVYVRKKLSYWADRNVLQATPSFPMGNLKGVGSEIHLTNRLKEIYDQFVGRDKFCGFYFMTSARILAMDPDFIKQILVKDFHKFQDRGIYYNEKHDPLSAHLFAIDGEKWKNLRTQLSPTFTSGKMKMMFGSILQLAEDFVDLLGDHVDQREAIDSRMVSVRFSADVIGLCAFGLQCNALKDPSTKIMELTHFFDFKDTKRKTLFLFINTFQGFSKMLGLKVTPSDIETFFMGVIKDTVEYREKNGVHRNDFMSLLMEIKKNGKLQGDDKNEDLGKMTFNELAAQSFVFFIAGLETASTTLSFLLYELALNQDVQTKLRNQVNAVLNKHNGELNYESVMEMDYAEWCINESLRMYSPITNLFRICKEDYKVQETEHILAKGTIVLIPILAIHQNPEYFPEPTKFIPERFHPTEVKKRHPFTYLPFGEGPRNCIGMRFSMLQIRIAIASLITKYRFTVNEKTETPIQLDVRDLMMIVKGGMWLDAERI